MPVGEVLRLLAALVVLLVSMATAGFAGIFLGDAWRVSPRRENPARVGDVLIGLIGAGVTAAISLAIGVLGAWLWQDWRPALIPPAVVLIAAAALRRPQPRQPWEQA